ncbi:MAG: hypothetical protein KJZ66_03395, partial [Candidatus Kuenenia stuttgartiensis]|nr:hypothetical protein [Candidatus Kuenenia stuttgartiensis]
MIGAKQRCQGLILLYVSLKTWQKSQKTGNAPGSTPQVHESCKGCGKPVPRWRGIKGVELSAERG